MAIRQIRIYPDPVLRVRCAPVEQFDDSLKQLIDDMVETMHKAPGVGLAAPQIGVEMQVAVIDVSVGKEEGALRTFINPRLVEEQGSEVDFEGCLSIPDLSEKIKRPKQIRVAAVDETGTPFELELEDFEARAVCHEVDHLNGVLFIDHLRGLRREKVRRKLRRMGMA